MALQYVPVVHAHPFTPTHMVENLHNDVGNAPGTLDGSLSRITALLRELIALTGHDGGGVPVLELQFGDILTRTTLHALDKNYLLITAILPKCGDSRHVCVPAGTGPAPHGQDMEFLWHADEGRYVGLRMVPIRSLPDERSVMDAILATSDQASAWMMARGRQS
jgi:hypothetical protein